MSPTGGGGRIREHTRNERTYSQLLNPPRPRRHRRRPSRDDANTRMAFETRVLLVAREVVAERASDATNGLRSRVNNVERSYEGMSGNSCSEVSSCKLNAVQGTIYHVRFWQNGNCIQHSLVSAARLVRRSFSIANSPSVYPAPIHLLSNSQAPLNRIRSVITEIRQQNSTGFDERSGGLRRARDDVFTA